MLPRAHGVVVSHPLSMREALGSNPSVSTFFVYTLSWCCQSFGLQYNPEGLWRNGSASDSRSEGWEFESLWPHFTTTSGDV